MIIADCHNDWLTSNDENPSKYIDFCKKNKVKILFCSIFTYELNNAIETINTLSKKLNSKKIKLLLHIEDLGFVTTNTILNQIIALKPFSIGLTWNYNNTLAGGVNGNHGLTPWGRHVINRLKNTNIIIDIAHLNSISTKQMAHIYPIDFCSHTGLKAINNNVRNIDHNTITTIIKNKGIIGLFLVKHFFEPQLPKSFRIGKIFTIATNPLIKKYKHIQPKDSLDHYVQSILYFINHYDYHCLAIGTDYYGTDDLPQQLKNYDNFGLLIKRLKQANVSKHIIKCIMYKNVCRYIKKKQKRKKLDL